MAERNCPSFRWSKAESDMSLKELAERSVSHPLLISGVQGNGDGPFGRELFAPMDGSSLGLLLVLVRLQRLSLFWGVRPVRFDLRFFVDRCGRCAWALSVCSEALCRVRTGKR